MNTIKAKFGADLLNLLKIIGILLDANCVFNRNIGYVWVSVIWLLDHTSLC